MATTCDENAKHLDSQDAQYSETKLGVKAEDPSHVSAGSMGQAAQYKLSETDTETENSKASGDINTKFAADGEHAVSTATGLEFHAEGSTHSGQEDQGFGRKGRCTDGSEPKRRLARKPRTNSGDATKRQRKTGSAPTQQAPQALPKGIQLYRENPPPVEEVIAKFAANNYLSQLTDRLNDDDFESQGGDISDAVKEFRSLLSCYAALKHKAACLSQENQELFALLQHVTQSAPQQVSQQPFNNPRALAQAALAQNSKQHPVNQGPGQHDPNMALLQLMTAMNQNQRSPSGQLQFPHHMSPAQSGAHHPTQHFGSPSQNNTIPPNLGPALMQLLQSQGQVGSQMHPQMRMLLNLQQQTATAAALAAAAQPLPTSAPSPPKNAAPTMDDRKFADISALLQSLRRPEQQRSVSGNATSDAGSQIPVAWQQAQAQGAHSEQRTRASHSQLQTRPQGATGSLSPEQLAAAMLHEHGGDFNKALLNLLSMSMKDGKSDV